MRSSKEHKETAKNSTVNMNSIENADVTDAAVASAATVSFVAPKGRPKKSAATKNKRKKSIAKKRKNICYNMGKTIADRFKNQSS